MKIGSLFSGIGGLELGLEMCGLGPVIWQAESDPYARAVLAKHWPEVKRYNDVREIDEQAERPDIICGGFPCQDISDAGKRAGIDGERSGIWSEFARTIRALRPDYVFIENVAALIVRGLGRVLSDLAACGYDAEWNCFRASDVGAPHRRERIFILAYSDCGRKLQSQGSVERIGRWSGDSSQDLANPDSKSQFKQDDQAGTESRKWTRENISRRGWWESQPDVDGAIDGFSGWLDGNPLIPEAHTALWDYAHAKKIDPGEVLRFLRVADGAQSIQWPTGGPGGVYSQEILWTFLRKLSCRPEAKELSPPRQEVPKGSVRSVPTSALVARPPRQRQTSGQQPGQPANIVYLLSQLLARLSESAWTAYRQSDAAPRLTWEAGYARTAHLVPNRVDRLRCLGNAVVPQQAALAFQTLIQKETSPTEAGLVPG